MYNPKKKGGRVNAAKANTIQTGGDYITSTVDPTTLSVSSISETTVSTIKSMAGLTSADEISQLTISQISSLIGAVTTQIGSENAQIIQNQQDILSIQAQINNPGGLQESYDTANEQYISVLKAYNYATEKLAYDQSIMTADMLELERLNALSAMYMSSVDGYNEQYSTIWSSIQGNNRQIALDSATYIAELNAYNTSRDNYSRALSSLISTNDALISESSLLSVAKHEYFLTSTTYGKLLDDYIHFSTHKLSISHAYYLSTNNYLCSLMDLHKTRFSQYLSTSTAFGIANMNVDAAQAAVDYRHAIVTEICTIVSYNNTEYALASIVDADVYRKKEVEVIPDILKAGIHEGKPRTASEPPGTNTQEGGAVPVGNSIEYYATNAIPIKGRELEYQTLYVLLSTLSTNLFSTTQARINAEKNQSNIETVTLLAILQAADADIAAAQLAFDTAQTNERNVISTIDGLSTRIGNAYISEKYYMSTLNSLSSLYEDDQKRYNNYISTINGYGVVESTLSSFLRSTMNTVDFLSIQSYLYNISIAIFQEAYDLYLSMEGVTQSSINGYSTIKGYMNSTIIGLTAEIGTPYSGLTQEINSQLVALNTNADIFYANKVDQYNNQMDEYKYGIQEWNSFIGYIVSQLLTKKLNYYTDIDSITFSLNAGNLTQDEISRLNQNKVQFTTNQSNIQSIINALNPIEQQFATVAQTVETMRTNIMYFINTRSVLTKYEIQVENNPNKLPEIQTDYINKLGDLNIRCMSINTDINTFNTQMGAIYTNYITPQMSLVAALNILSYTQPDLVPTNLGPFNLDLTEFQLLAPLNYSLNVLNYPLVLQASSQVATTTTAPPVEVLPLSV
jgi:hypothetical protein